MEKDLKKLGLSDHEAAIYLATLKNGPCLAGPIVKETRLHRMVVYKGLKTLEELKLISVITKNNRQHFYPTDPENILTPIHEQARLAQKLIPDLKALKSQKDSEMGVQMFYGKEGFWSNLQDMMDSAERTDKIMRIIGGAPSSVFYKAIGKHYDTYKTLLKKKGVAKWQLSPYAESQEFQNKFAKETPKNRLKLLPKGLSSPTYTRITPQMVSIEIYSEPMVIIQIKNKALAESYLEHFNLLW